MTTTPGGPGDDAIASSAAAFMGSGLAPAARPGMTPDLFALVTDRDGVEHRLEALEGYRLMEVIRDWGLSIEAECGGACACATCHVLVDTTWLAKLPPPREEEIERLDEIYDVRANSRLSCQILMRPEIGGIRVRLG